MKKGNTIMLILFLGSSLTYFFIAGMIFKDMTADIKEYPLWWPPIGAFILAILWIVVLMWGLVSIYSKRSKALYEKFAGTIFKEEAF